MKIYSSAFGNNEVVPVPYTCKGPNINPPLTFLEIPEKTQSLVLIVEDITADGKPWVHWLVYNIPPTAAGFEEEKIPDGSVQGICNGGTYGYEGPCPIYFNGTHHYHFTLYALDTVLDVPKTADKAVITQEMADHVLDTAQLVGIAEGTKE
jgi:Raf kinase inhibitor-like YbhB/YbcL family protein